MTVLLNKDTITVYRAKEGSYVNGEYVAGYQTVTLTLSANLITGNTFACTVTAINKDTGTEIVTNVSELFDTNHLTTMNNISSAIESDTVGIDTALVSGTTNRILTINANSDYIIEVSGISITGGLTQSTVTQSSSNSLSNVTEVLTFDGNIQPDFGDSDYLTIKDEKQRTGKDNIGIIKVFSKSNPFYSQDNSPMAKADRILYNGNYYEVRGTSTWQGIGLNHYKALAFLIQSEDL
jgi:hypothetical protein